MAAPSNSQGAGGAVPGRGDFPVLRSMPTRWLDNDQYGHVNNVVYYAYFDSAVNGFLMEAVSADIRILPAIGVVAETSCRFLEPVSFPDLLHVGLRVGRLGERSVTYELGVFRGEDIDPAAVGRFVHVYVDRGTRRPVSIPPIIRTALERAIPGHAMSGNTVKSKQSNEANGQEAR